MHYSAIKTCDIANGTGVRTTLFVSGCRNHCEGCFNPETWDFNHGSVYTEETKKEILDACEPKHVAGLTLLGGEPFEPENQGTLVDLLKAFRERFPEKNVWCFTGYTLETDLLAHDGVSRCEYTDEMLNLIDTLVDGRFILEKKDITLKFRGSSNQRILDLKEVLKEYRLNQENAAPELVQEIA